MDFPKRTKTHISESRSFDIVSKALPNQWIIREITERDYGIDLYVEIVMDNNFVTGDLIALQVKSTDNISFSEGGNFSLKGIKNSTLNYWNQLPVPVFVLLVNLLDENIYWCNIKYAQRCGHYKNLFKTSSLRFKRKNNMSENGITYFIYSYIKEKNWTKTENAIEKSLMFYNGLGPLFLMCKRKDKMEICSSTIQYLVLQHYEYYTILSEHFLDKTPKPLSTWYQRNEQIQKDSGFLTSCEFHYQTIMEMLEELIYDYRKCIIQAYILVTERQKDYFTTKKKYLVNLLHNRPHTFVMDDWYPRYYFDEYEDETKNPEKLFFEDFDEFDKILEDLDLS